MHSNIGTLVSFELSLSNRSKSSSISSATFLKRSRCSKELDELFSKTFDNGAGELGRPQESIN